MTNDLNTIPASVRDGLRQIKTDSHTECHETWFGQLATEALPLIERLCQPNIVIVDLDELRADIDKIPLGQESILRGASEYNWGKYWIAKLAALKEMI